MNFLKILDLSLKTMTDLLFGFLNLKLFESFEMNFLVNLLSVRSSSKELQFLEPISKAGSVSTFELEVLERASKIINFIMICIKKTL